MEKPNVIELTEVPKHTDDNAGAKLRSILEKHICTDPEDNRKIVEMLDPETVGLSNPNKGIVACVGLLPKYENSPIPEHRCLYEFMDNGICVANCHDGTPTVYGGWNDGYRRLVHDIRDFWRQREIDAQTMAQPYMRLYASMK